jgi:predicted amidophosphoribosyltransferase
VVQYKGHLWLNVDDPLLDLVDDLRVYLTSDSAVAKAIKQKEDHCIKIEPRKISGNWTHGWALDLHTVRSVPLGPDEWGHEMFDTTRSNIGEAVYKLKYKADKSQVGPIADTMASFIRSKPEFDDICAIIAIPPSNTTRRFQPVPAIAAVVGAQLGLPVPTNYLLKIKQTTPLKGMNDRQKRHEELEGAFKVADNRFAGKHVLLVDDLFRSGETLNAVSATLISAGKVAKVSAVTATITRSRR